MIASALVREHALHWTARYRNGGPTELTADELSTLLTWVREYAARTRCEHAEAAVRLDLPPHLSTPLTLDELAGIMAVDGLNIIPPDRCYVPFAALVQAAEGAA